MGRASRVGLGWVGGGAGQGVPSRGRGRGWASMGRPYIYIYIYICIPCSASKLRVDRQCTACCAFSQDPSSDSTAPKGSHPALAQGLGTTIPSCGAVQAAGDRRFCTQSFLLYVCMCCFAVSIRLVVVVYMLLCTSSTVR